MMLVKLDVLRNVCNVALVIKSYCAFFTSLCDFLIPFFGRWEMGKEKLAQRVMNSVFVIFPKLTSFHIRRMNIEST